MNRKTWFASAALFLAALLVASTGAAWAATADELNYDERAPDPYIVEDNVTKEKHKMSWDLLEYEDDSGDLVALEAVVNTTPDNPFAFTATDIDLDGFQAFPRKSGETNNSESWKDKDDWTVAGNNSAKLSVDEVETASDVPALRIYTDGTLGTGEWANATYSNFSITSDESKRYLKIAADIDTLDSGALVNITVVDEDNDTKQLQIDPSGNQSTSTILASATGEGHVSQVQLTDLATNDSDSDGWNNIERIIVTVQDGDVDLSISWLDLEQKGKTKFGVKKENKDSDDALETTDIYEPHGLIQIYDLDTMDSYFDDATIHGLKFPVMHRAKLLTDSSTYQIETSNAPDYPTYDKLLTVHYRLKVPSAIDLSHSGLKLMQEQQWPSSRYVTVKVAESVSENTNYENISWDSNKVGSFDTLGDNVTLDSTVSATSSDTYVVKEEILLTDEEWDALQVSAATPTSTPAGGAGQFEEENSGGIMGWFMTGYNWLTGVGLGVLAAVGLRRRGK